MDSYSSDPAGAAVLIVTIRKTGDPEECFVATHGGDSFGIRGRRIAAGGPSSGFVVRGGGGPVLSDRFHFSCQNLTAAGPWRNGEKEEDGRAN